MNTLTYGIQVPQTGDIGSVFFPALEDNFTQLDAHNHDGVTSSKIMSSSVKSTTQSILAAAWVAVAGVAGLYNQVVTMPTGLQYDDYVPMFKMSTGDLLFLTVEKASATSYTVYCNDNTLTVTALYIS